MHLKTVFFALLLILPAAGGDLTEPTNFFGHRMGEDRKLISYDQGIKYLQTLEKESDRIKLYDLGQSTLKNPIFMAAISTPENLKNAEKYIEISRKLLSGRVKQAEARKLAKEGKAIVLITCNIHSSEIVSSQTAPELAYELVKGKVPLDNVILLLMPSINPDGQLMIKDWYDKHVGSKWEGGRMPWLYHNYAGHDNNRDWFMFNLVESGIVSEVYYKSWMPQVIVDHHQMGSTGARIWVPPYSDPPNPNVHPLVYRWLNVYGTHMALDLEREDRKGVSSQWIFTSWWPGTSIMTPWWHNRIGILTESASCKIASPMFVDPGEATAKEHTVIQPNPWKGGWWKMRDIVENQLTTSYTVVEVSDKYKEELLFHSWKMASDQVKAGENEKPYAYIIPSDQRDFSAVKRLTEALHVTNVEMYAADAPFQANGKEYPTGTTIIPLAQPVRGYIKDLFERQRYPSKERPYDMSGWTFSLQMGVDVIAAGERFDWKGKRVDAAKPPTGDSVPSSMYAAIPPGQTALAKITNHLFTKGSKLFWLAEAHKDLPAGTLIVRLDKKSRETLARNARWYGLKIKPFNDSPQVYKLKKPRLGLFKPWMASKDEGWTRLVLENFEFEYKNIDNKRMQEGELSKDFDCILFPDIAPSIIKSGRTSADDKGPEYFPEKYQGGIGEKGEKALKKFVEDGGTILCLDSSSDYAISTFNLPVKNVLKDNKDFAAPGAVLACEIDPTHPIGFGYAEKGHLYFVNSPAFQTSVPPRVDIQRRVVVRFPAKKSALVSGYIEGESAIRGRSALVECRLGDGRVVLYGFRPQHRAQSWGTFKYLFNAIHLSAAEKMRLP